MTDRPRIAGGVATAVLLLAASACVNKAEPTSDAEPEVGSDPTAQEFVTRPDLVAPEIDFAGEDPAEATGAPSGDLVFLAPKDGSGPMRGPVILDSAGEPVWISPVGDRWAYDFRVQQYQGKPVLTQWRGRHTAGGYGYGEYVLMDRSYREVATTTTPGLHADFHNGTLTSHGTALMTSFPIIKRDLTSIGGPENGYVANCVVQEVDIKTGKVVFEWSAIDDVPLSETWADPEDNPEEPGTKQAPLDPYHVNSVYEDGKNGLLVSARNTSAVYRIDQKSGDLDWTLGGTGSDFEMQGNSEFAYQHDAQRQPDGTITLFDNESSPPVGDQSRGLRLAVDEKDHTAKVVRQYLPPEDRLSSSQGNMQVRANGNVVIGWGSELYYSEYTPDGKLLTDASVDGQSYRVYRFPWHAEPTEPPKFVYQDGAGYVSWNGSTEVDSWRFIAGTDEQSAKEVETVPRDGFETSLTMPDRPYIAAQALDKAGNVLATAEPGAWPIGMVEYPDKRQPDTQGKDEKGTDKQDSAQDSD
ncbi:MAG: arylsulfotransferase family protein [Nocardioidaceae bacterium]